MHLLFLNPMRGNFENLAPVARADTKAALEAFLAREKVEPYVDAGADAFGPGDKSYTKNYRKGGPLEWFNPPDRPECWRVLSLEHWLERTRQQWAHDVLSLPAV